MRNKILSFFIIICCLCIPTKANAKILWKISDYEYNFSVMPKKDLDSLDFEEDSDLNTIYSGDGGQNYANIIEFSKLDPTFNSMSCEVDITGDALYRDIDNYACEWDHEHFGDSIITIKNPDLKYVKKFLIHIIQINVSSVYKSEKKASIRLRGNNKGNTLVLKIGNKTYKKRIRNSKTNQKITFKIKKTAPYQTIKTYIQLNGNRKSNYEKEHVYYAKRIKKGMTKKQVRYTSEWGEPESTSTYSSGYTFWWYEDGSYAVFKNGKVNRWRKVS